MIDYRVFGSFVSENPE